MIKQIKHDKFYRKCKNKNEYIIFKKSFNHEFCLIKLIKYYIYQFINKYLKILLSLFIINTNKTLLKVKNIKL